MNAVTARLELASAQTLDYNRRQKKRNRRVRDIRTDLKERIAAKRQERTRLLAEADQAEADAAAFERLLAEEDRRIVRDQVQGRFNAGAAEVNYGPPKAPLDMFILSEIERSPKTKEELRDGAAAVGYFTGQTSSPGRKVHATILHLVKAGQVVVQPGGLVMSSRQAKEKEKREATHRDLASISTELGGSQHDQRLVFPAGRRCGA